MQIERLVPGPLKNHYRRLRSSIKNRAFGSSNADIFDVIYQDGCWGSSAESNLYSGPGTYDPAVSEYVDYVLTFIREREVRTVVEIGCGDFVIGQRYAGKVDSYIGIDASSIVIAKNKEEFGTDRISFVHADATDVDLPPSDLCIIRQVLQHLDNRSIAGILRRAAVHKYVLVTEHLPGPNQLDRPNANKRTGPDTRLIFGSGVFVELPPFNQAGETVLSLPVAVAQAHPGEIMRTTLIRND